MKIGFIGLGNMGGPMCRNLIKGVNHPVVVFDLNAEAVAGCTALGATAAASPAELGAECEVIFTSLPTPAIVESVLLAVAEGASPGTVVIDLSTNAPGVVRRLAETLAAKGVTLLDAPVTGGVARAIDGSLVIMAGGDEAKLEPNRALLATMSSQVVHVGPAGSATVAKLINNMILLCNTAAAAEGLMIGAMAGIDLTKLTGIVMNGSGTSNGFRSTSTRALQGDFTASFALDLAWKDMKLAVELENELGVPSVMGGPALSLLHMARGLGLGSSDFTAILKVYENLLGKEARA